MPERDDTVDSRRRHRRTPSLHLEPVAVQRGDGGQAFYGVLLDHSAGGVQIAFLPTACADLEPGEHIQVQTDSASSSSAGEVCWARPTSGGGARIGVRMLPTPQG